VPGARGVQYVDVQGNVNFVHVGGVIHRRLGDRLRSPGGYLPGGDHFHPGVRLQALELGGKVRAHPQKRTARREKPGHSRVLRATHAWDRGSLELVLQVGVGIELDVAKIL